MKILLVLMLLTLMGCQSKNYDLAYVTDRDNTLDICITNSEINLRGFI